MKIRTMILMSLEYVPSTKPNAVHQQNADEKFADLVSIMRMGLASEAQVYLSTDDDKAGSLYNWSIVDQQFVPLNQPAV